MNTEQFYVWNQYWGELISDEDQRFPSTIFGFENCSEQNKSKSQFSFTEDGAIYGFVERGSVFVKSDQVQWKINKGQWFCVPGKSTQITLSEESNLFVTQRKDFHALLVMGGPIEEKGRLTYIDGCTDSLLCSPPICGDPCLNLLHFPPNINQTMHTHPSTRTGIVSSGNGFCVTENEEISLKPGQIFYLPRNTKHNFKTDSKNVLNVISYHPDSDWGPTNTHHPMINRTWVDGKKIE